MGVWWWLLVCYGCGSVGCIVGYVFASAVLRSYEVHAEQVIAELSAQIPETETP